MHFQAGGTQALEHLPPSMELWVSWKSLEQLFSLPLPSLLVATGTLPWGNMHSAPGLKPLGQERQ